MDLGSFSVSLNVKDIERSKVFYESLGFEVFFGDQAQNWLIMKSGDHKIGLFQGMFESNILTFNPGWDANGNTLDDYDDIRLIHKHIKSNGIKTINDSIKGEEGPSHFSVIDPDGNVILFDQHI